MDNGTRQPNETKKNRRRILRFDALLWFLFFLTCGWLMTFISGTLGLQRESEQWLPESIVARVSANYSPDETINVKRVAPQIIDAVKEDDLREELTLAATPIVNILELDDELPTATPTATPQESTFAPALTVNAGGPYQGNEGSPVNVAVEGLDAIVGNALGAITYRWDLNNNGNYTDAVGKSASITFFDEGEYFVNVQAEDVLGRTTTDQAVINVRNVPPTVTLGDDFWINEAANFLLDATVSDPGNDILIYEWDFGDGSQKVYDTLRPEHSYKDDGDYAVTLRVRDNDGGAGEDSLVVFVANVPPEADAGGDRITDEGASITLTGSGSDVSEEDDLSYAWDFDYDGDNFDVEASGSQVSTVYPNGPATAVAALRVEDGDGGSTVDTLNVTVNNVPPVILNVSNDGPVGEGRPLTLSVSATDAGNDPLTFDYDWENDGTFDDTQQSSSLSNIWFDEGDYTVGIRADDGDGGQAFTTTVVSTFNLTPTAIAQGPAGVVFEGSAVTFDGSESSDPGINDVLTYDWTFGDGSPAANGVIVNHVYANNGTYNATLTVTDDSGAADSDSVSVTVVNANPVADAGPDITINEGEDITLNFNGSAIDPGNDVLTYTWDFDYDGVTFNQDAIGSSVSNFYTELDGPPDEFVVALRVQDEDYPYPISGGGEIGEDIDTLRVTVNNVAPTNIDPLDPFNGEVGQPLELSAATAIDIPSDILTYQWDFDYDGSNFNVDGTGQDNVFNTWNATGIYRAALRVVDEDGGVSLITAFDVTISGDPVADAGGPYSGLEGSPITFDGRSSSDPPEDSLTYTWNFGDGSPTVNGDLVTHAYGDNGVYTATLTVTDPDSNSDIDTTTVTIHNANPVVNLGDIGITEGVPFNLNAGATDPGVNDTLSYAWDLDYDGITFNIDATGNPANITYPDGPASYMVRVRVRDDDYPYTGGGEIGEAADTLTITVSNAAPVVNAGGPYNGLKDQPLPLTGSATDSGDDTLTYQWDYLYNGVTFTPDITGSLTVTPTYTTSGVFTAALRVTDSDGAIGFDTAVVQINTAPTANANGPYSGDEGVAITLTGSGNDADGDPLTYAWDLDNNGTFETPGQIITTTFPDNNVYPVVLQVDDGRGGVATQTTTVTVNNVPPTANANGPYNTTLAALPITLSGSGSDVPADTLTYEWDLQNDGTFEVSGQTASFTQTITGTFTVAFRVSDDDGDSTVDTTTVQVNN